MTIIFFGEYERSLDSKGRLILPAELLKELDESDGGRVLWMTLGLDTNLYLYTQSEWEAIVRRIRAKRDMKARDGVRKFFASAKKVEPDKQGRISLPAKLLGEAEIAKDVVVAGVMDRIEIWSADRYGKVNDRMEEDGTYQVLVEELLSGRDDDDSDS